jgi:uncharacterized membrane protein
MDALKFFSKKQKNRMLKAIQESENKTSGEIRLHIENHCESSLLDRAKDVFHILQMHRTEKRNGVLIYLALADKKVAILGDDGIDSVTPDDYWQNEVNMLLNHFKIAEFELGIIKVIQHIGDKLKSHFPIESNDINELSDEISFFNN